MTTYISLLRGINVSGQKKIQMKELKSLYESLGLENVITYIQSGNVIFSCGEKNELKLVDLISNKIRDVFGFDVSVVIRSKDDWVKIIKNNTLINRKDIDPQKLYVTLLSQITSRINTDVLDKVKHNSEEYVVGEREIYLYCPEGYGRTKLSNNYIENKLKIGATTRNWNTVYKLFEITDQ
jgi:uncharacterized protein (DUF1697 family)